MHLGSAIGHVKRGLSYQLYWYHPLWIKVLNQLKMDLQAVLQLRRLFRFLLGQGTSIWFIADPIASSHFRAADDFT